MDESLQLVCSVWSVRANQGYIKKWEVFMTCEQERGEGGVSRSHQKFQTRRRQLLRQWQLCFAAAFKGILGVHDCRNLSVFCKQKGWAGTQKERIREKVKRDKSGEWHRVYHKSICLIDEVNSIKFIENHLENSELITLSPLFASWPLFIIFFNYQSFMLLNVKSK